MFRFPRRRWIRRWFVRPVLAIGLAGAVAVFVLPRLMPYPETLLERDRRTAVVRAADGEPIRFVRDRAGRRHVPVRLADVSPHLVDAIIAVEDKRFRSHGGVDPMAVARAVKSNATAGRIVSGASTLTMQLARLLEPRPRSFVSKAREAFRALQLEQRLTKDEILERYLDLVPMGRNLRGVEAASWFWFGKSARDLDRSEAALLAGLPQSPTRLDPRARPEAAEARRRHVLDRMREAGSLTDDEHARAVARVPDARPHAFPFEAPHFAEIALARASDRSATTTLDRALQARAEEALRDRLDDLPDVDAGAIVVLDNRDASIRVLVGGPGWSTPGFGRVNLATRRRSPGSTLKPFLTALALERGEILPGTLLADVPGGEAGYEPGNFDGSHRGLVTARDALRQSLNVPAIRLLRRVGTASLLARLGRLGLGSLADGPDDHGLALVLGGGEVSLLDLTAAYAALACEGRYRTPRVLADAPVRPGVAVFAAGIARETAEMLAIRDGPRTGAGESVLAVKTGTSNGRRDAWSIGFDPDWTVGVWLGNPRGRASEHLVGATAATPLLLEVFRALRERRPGRWFAPIGEGRRVTVCLDSGHRATERCPRTAVRRAAIGAARTRSCDLHRTVLLDTASGEIRCGRCLEGHPVRRGVAIVLPPEVRAFLARTGAADLGPPHAADCPTVARPPAISSPEEGATYVGRLPLRTDRPVDWFVDGRPVGRGRSRAVRVPAGTHVVRAVGDDGSSASVTIRSH